MLHRPSFDLEIKSYKEQQNAAVELIQIISNLWYNRAVELVLFREQLVDEKVSVILNHLRQNTIFNGNTVTIFDVLNVARVLEKFNLAPARIDIGKLAAKSIKNTCDELQLADFISNELKGINASQELKPRDVVLYGFGRIGRLLARELINKSGSGQQLRLRARVTRDGHDAKS